VTTSLWVEVFRLPAEKTEPEAGPSGKVEDAVREVIAAAVDGVDDAGDTLDGRDVAEARGELARIEGLDG
jgi:hypothetical protein